LKELFIAKKKFAVNYIVGEKGTGEFTSTAFSDYVGQKKEFVLALYKQDNWFFSLSLIFMYIYNEILRAI